MIGIYNKADRKLLERCSPQELPKALKDWKDLGYETYLGNPFPNLYILTPKQKHA